MRRVERKQLVSERDWSMSTRARQQQEESAWRKKDWRSGSSTGERESPTHETTVDWSSAYAGGCLDDSDGSMRAP
jgi:hypothetical protein